MNLTPLYNKKGPLRIAGFMSGTGSNLRKIIEYQKKVHYEVVVIFSDNCDSSALKIGVEFDIPVIVRDLSSFCKFRRRCRVDVSVRKEFDQEIIKALTPYEVAVIAYAGYMSVATKDLVEAFLGVNIHPADLSIEMSGGERKYVGVNAVKDAILAGESVLKSTTHIVRPFVDEGPLLMISSGIPVLPQKPFEISDADIELHQERLKKAGDWIIFPKTLQYIAEGRYEQDENDNLYFDGKRIPQGLKL